MRIAMLVLLLGGFACGQALLENAAAAAGGSVGGVAGRKVSDGISGIFNKVNRQTGKAAATAKDRPARDDEPAFEVGPGVAKPVSVPPPPPLKHASVHRPAPRRASERAPERVPQIAAPAPPPRPHVDAGELEQLAAGTSRDNLLKMGAPAARITMFEDGHLVEIYRYMSGDSSLGAVRLTDGAVSSVQLR